MNWLVLVCGGGAGIGEALAFIILIAMSIPVLGTLGVGVAIWLIARAWRQQPRPVAILGPTPAPAPRPVVTWARGERPNGGTLDAEARTALEQSWLADARREHQTVARLARSAWLLTAAGAPASLVERMQRAGMAKVGHAQTCFAIAAGYGRRTLGIEARADLLAPELPQKTDPRVALISDVIESGCFLARFRAAVAWARVAECRDPVVRDALSNLARDDAERAELSWEVLRWVLQEEPQMARHVARRTLRQLSKVERPEWVAAATERWLKAQPFQTLAPLGLMRPQQVRELFEQQLSIEQRRLEALVGSGIGSAAVAIARG